VPGGKPQREAPPPVPTALMQEAQIAADDMKATTGIYDSALGAKSNETSGVAIRSRQTEADTANFHFIDNLQRSLEYCGRILIDLIPKVYDNERVIRLTGDATKPDQTVAINKVVMGQDGYPVVINDLSAAHFDVRVTIGKSYTTKRAEAANQMLELMRTLPPEAAMALGYLAVKNLDLVDGEEATRILKNMIPPQLLVDPDNLPPPPPPDPMEEMAKASQAQTMTATARKAAAEADRAELENQFAFGVAPSPPPMMSQPEPEQPQQGQFPPF